MAELALDLDLASVGQARAWMGSCLSGWSEPGRSRAVLVTSELVANGLIHARTPLALALHVEGDRARIEITDSDPTAPSTKHYGTDAPTGRGLHMVASLSEEWGARPTGTGKTVWALVRDEPWDQTGPEGTPDMQFSPDPAPGDTPGRTVVQLLAVPMPVLLEAQQHTDELRRELVFVAGSGHLSSRLDALARELTEHVGPAAGDINGQINDALAGREAAIDIVMDMSPQGWQAVRELSSLLDEADLYCERLELLTLASSPAVRAFRRWYSEEVRGQTQGDPPRAWPG